MFDWQMIAALVCVVLAGHFVVRRLLKLANSRDSDGCGSCNSKQTPPAKSKPIVPLDLPGQRR